MLKLNNAYTHVPAKNNTTRDSKTSTSLNFTSNSPIYRFERNLSGAQLKDLKTPAILKDPKILGLDSNSLASKAINSKEIDGLLPEITINNVNKIARRTKVPFKPFIGSLIVESDLTERILNKALKGDSYNAQALKSQTMRKAQNLLTPAYGTDRLEQQTQNFIVDLLKNHGDKAQLDFLYNHVVFNREISTETRIKALDTMITLAHKPTVQAQELREMSECMQYLTIEKSSDLYKETAKTRKSFLNIARLKEEK